MGMPGGHRTEVQGSLGDAVPVALQEEDSPSTESASGLPMKWDRSFSEQDLAQFQSELAGGHAAPKVLESLDPEPRPRSGTSAIPQAQSCVGIPIPWTVSVPVLSTAHPMSRMPCDIPLPVSPRVTLPCPPANTCWRSCVWQRVLTVSSRCPTMQALSPPATTQCHMAPHPALPWAPWRRGQRMAPALRPAAAPSTSGW